MRSPISGPATWIISGIHGEEVAGPNAIAAAIDDIAKLGEHRPVVLIPLSNPHGYVRNWRYLNSPIWSHDIDAQSVGDSSHLLPDPENSQQARAAVASSPEADAITRYILETMEGYPPLISIDLHEDDQIVMARVIDPGLVTSERFYVDVNIDHDISYGVSVGGREIRPGAEGAQQVNVRYDLHWPGFIEMLVERIQRPLRWVIAAENHCDLHHTFTCPCEY